jgi:energy-coupling factor transporter ATP-binding protein EcfA2
MINRLELFRSQIAAFDGAADPMNAISKGYFIEEPHQSSTNALFKRISLRPQSKILLIGGIGSGKTTQLLKLQQIFQQAPDTGIYPHYIDVTKYTKPNDLQVGTLNAIVGLEMVIFLEKKGFVVNKGTKEFIQEFAYGYIVTQYIGEPPDDYEPDEHEYEYSYKVPGVLSSHPRSLDSLDRLTKELLSLIEDFQAVFQQKPYFLFDGLDRVDELRKFTKMVLSDLQNAKIGFAIVGAPSLVYSSLSDEIDGINSIFNHIEYRSAFDVKQDEEARIFFESVLLARSDQDFFQQAALQDLIRLSGGVLRDLINLTQESIQEAYLADAENVDRDHVEKAVLSMGRAKILGLNNKQHSTLASLVNSKLDIPTSPEEIYFLSTGKILEYRFPERRFDLHPVLKEVLVGVKGAKGTKGAKR